MIDYAWYGATGEDVTVGCRATGPGVVRLSLADGRVLMETADPGINDGHVYFTIAMPATRPTIEGTLNHGADYPHRMRLRALPKDKLRAIVYSCQANQVTANHAYGVMAGYSPDLLICLGDFVYADSTHGTINGEAVTNVRYQVIRTVGAAAYRPHYRALKKNPMFRAIAARVPIWCMWHDHELFDGWSRGSLCNINKFYHPSSTSYDADPLTVEQVPASFTNAQADAAMQAIYDAGATAFREHFGRTNPPAQTDLDPNALYFRYRLGGLAEFVVPDDVSYCDLWSNRAGLNTIYTDITGWPYYGAAQDNLRQCHKAPQQQWILDSLENAEADGVPHKFLLSPTQLYEHGADAENNGNTMASCTGERDAIVAAFSGLTGAVAISGDSHQACVYGDEANGFRCVMPGSLSSGIHTQGAGYAANTRWKIWGVDGTPSGTECSYVFEVLDVTKSSQTHRVVDAHAGAEQWGMTLPAGEQPSQGRRVKI